jgi:cyclophilin family peptidyl-prolyl cis-trans isomerase
MKCQAILSCLLFTVLLPVRAGTLAQFRTVFGDIEVELYDQDKPVTVQNFIRYVQSDAWRDMFVHRCDTNFVIQGGGYSVANRGTTNPFIAQVTNYGSIVNEFGAGRRFSNVYGTLSMAKLAGNTNSASSQWFFNLNANTFLDTPDTNNFFTVFGHVVRGTNVLNVFKTFSRSTPTNVIADLRFDLGVAFGEMPLLTTNATFNDLIYVDVSLLNIQVRRTSNGVPEISWNSVSNQLNHVEFTLGFPPDWQLLASTNGTGGTMQVADPTATELFRFYRVRVDY